MWDSSSKSRAVAPITGKAWAIGFPTTLRFPLFVALSIAFVRACVEFAVWKGTFVISSVACARSAARRGTDSTGGYVDGYVDGYGYGYGTTRGHGYDSRLQL